MNENDWQPSYDIPKGYPHFLPWNGEEVLIGKKVGGEWRVCQAAGSFFLGRDDPSGYEPDIYWRNEDADWGGITDDEGPTHWMALKEPGEQT